MRKLLFLSLLLFPARAMASIYIDTASVTTSSASTGSSVSWSHNTYASKSFFLVTTSLRDATAGNRPVVSITYGGVPLTKIREDDDSLNNQAVGFWYLLSPPPGTKTVAITFTGNIGIMAVGTAMNIYGVNLSSAVDRSGTANSGATGSNPSLTFTTNQNDVMVVDSLYGQGIANTANAGQVPLNNINGVSANNDDMGTSYKQLVGGPQSVTMGWTTTPTLDRWILSAISIKPDIGKIRFIRR